MARDNSKEHQQRRTMCEAHVKTTKTVVADSHLCTHAVVRVQPKLEIGNVTTAPLYHDSVQSDVGHAVTALRLVRVERTNQQICKSGAGSGAEQ